MNDLVAGRGEQLATDYLEERGWTIVARNWSDPKLGEIDIVVSRTTPWDSGEVLLVAFVEVKACANGGGIAPELHVNERKRKKLVTLAKLFIVRNKLKRARVRFDVIGVDLEPLEIRHYPDAFDAQGRLR